MSPSAIEAIEKLASEKDEERRIACGALATHCHGAALSIIVACLAGVAGKDAVHQVREAAFEALRQISAKSGRSAMDSPASLIKDEQAEVHVRNHPSELRR